MHFTRWQERSRVRRRRWMVIGCYWTRLDQIVLGKHSMNFERRIISADRLPSFATRIHGCTVEWRHSSDHVFHRSLYRPAREDLCPVTFSIDEDTDFGEGRVLPGSWCFQFQLQLMAHQRNFIELRENLLSSDFVRYLHEKSSQSLRPLLMVGLLLLGLRIQRRSPRDVCLLQRSNRLA